MSSGVGIRGGGPKRVAARTAKCARQRGDVLPPLAQRRQLDREDRDPVPEVLAEAARPATIAAQVAVRRRDDAHVDVGAGCWPPTRSNVAVLQDAQQAHLRRERQLADLVEEQRAAVGALEPALAASRPRR